MKTNNEILKELRQAANLTPEQVAKALCRHEATVRNWEVPGSKQGPPTHCLERLSELYGYPIHELFPPKKRKLELFKSDKLAELRKAKGITIWKLCGELGYVCTPQALHLLERGKASPSKERTAQLAKYYGVDESYFFD